MRTKRADTITILPVHDDPNHWFTPRTLFSRISRFHGLLFGTLSRMMNPVPTKTFPPPWFHSASGLWHQDVEQAVFWRCYVLDAFFIQDQRLGVRDCPRQEEKKQALRRGR